MLNDRQILNALNGHNKHSPRIVIDPFNREFLGPNSYDLTLSGKYKEFVGRFGADNPIDTTKDIPDYYSYVDGSYGGLIKCRPGKTIIVMSREIIGVTRPYVGIISPRSGISRLPISISYSHLVDTGYKGIIGASFTNHSDVELDFHEGQRFMQIMFHTCSGNIMRTYSGRDSSKYLKNDGSDVPVYKIDKEWLKDADKL